MADTLASPSQFMARTAHSVTFLATPYVSPPMVAAVCVPCPAWRVRRDVGKCKSDAQLHPCLPHEEAPR